MRGPRKGAWSAGEGVSHDLEAVSSVEWAWIEVLRELVLKTKRGLIAAGDFWRPFEIPGDVDIAVLWEWFWNWGSVERKVARAPKFRGERKLGAINRSSSF